MADSSRWLRPLGCVALLALAACGGGGTDTSPGQAGTNGGAGTGATAGAGGGPVGAAGTSAGSAGASGTGGAATTGAAGTGGSVGSGGRGGSTSSGAAGNGAPGGAGGAVSTGGAGAGGSNAAGAGGTSAGGRGGSGGTATGGTGGATAACSRDLLKSTITAYFTALAAHDPSTLPLATTVKFTENGTTMTLSGTAGLWRTAGMVKHTQSALDVDQCSSATHSVVPEGSMDIPVALRLKLVNQRITEIETIAVRPGDYSLGANNPAAIITIASTVRWEEAPTGTRATRAELIAWMDKYFRMFPRGVCNTTSACRRLENGGGNFVCSNGGSCAAGQPTGTPAMTPRLILADAETGIGVGFTMFMGNTDMHMFKMYGGEVHAVHAILGEASSSGW